MTNSKFQSISLGENGGFQSIPQTVVAARPYGLQNPPPSEVEEKLKELGKERKARAREILRLIEEPANEEEEIIRKLLIAKNPKLEDSDHRLHLRRYDLYEDGPLPDPFPEEIRSCIRGEELLRLIDKPSTQEENVIRQLVIKKHPKLLDENSNERFRLRRFTCSICFDGSVIYDPCFHRDPSLDVQNSDERANSQCSKLPTTSRDRDNENFNKGCEILTVKLSTPLQEEIDFLEKGFNGQITYFNCFFESKYTISDEGDVNQILRIDLKTNTWYFLLKVSRNFPQKSEDEPFPVTAYLVSPCNEELIGFIRSGLLRGLKVSKDGLIYVDCKYEGKRHPIIAGLRKQLKLNFNCKETIEYILQLVPFIDSCVRHIKRRRSLCSKIVLSDRAFVQIYNETKSRFRTETGGLLLGHYDNGIWYVVEASDPGISGVFKIAYHESDEKYQNHVCSVISRLYKNPLIFLGMWHRHPGSMDTFSSTDDGTNYKHARIVGHGCISALVNYDPDFRLTFYYVDIESSDRVNYSRINVEVGDDKILNKEVIKLKEVPELHR